MIPADGHGATLRRAASEHSREVSRELHHLGASVSFGGTPGGMQGRLLPVGVSTEGKEAMLGTECSHPGPWALDGFYL